MIDGIMKPIISKLFHKLDKSKPIHTEDYLPLIKNLTSKIQKKDAHIGLLLTLLEEAAFLVYIIDDNFVVLFSSEDMTNDVGKKCFDVMCFETRPLEQCPLKKSLDTNQPEFMFHKCPADKNNEEHHALFIGLPLRNNGQKFVMGIKLTMFTKDMKNNLVDGLERCLKELKDGE